ncbi:hypothetical protein EAH73_02355 [Hymenobacter nivis]|uniref:Uncharacterized protein n=1 Tax=Hymenobacter nivis TaxID=1850093 RepID=A0A502HEK9_9BACT|nr:hypothetical protein EAH73_02355 [Hymenobacter nivis]
MLALATGCAGSYTSIRPDRIATYQASAANAPVEFGYQYDVLRLHGNKKYVKKEAKRGYHVTAVRVTNNSGRELNFSRDLNLLYGDRPVMPVGGTAAAQDMKQGVAVYLLYLLLNFNVGGTVDARTGATSGGTFIPTGPFIAGGNMLGASQANKNMRQEFEEFDLTNRIIKPGETVYGIMSLRETSVAPMRLELRPGTESTYVPAAAPVVLPAPPPAASPRRDD